MNIEFLGKEVTLRTGEICYFCNRRIFFVGHGLCTTHGDRELSMYDFKQWAYKPLSGWDYSYRREEW